MKIKHKPVVVRITEVLRFPISWTGMRDYVTIEILKHVSCQTEVRAYVNIQGVSDSVRQHFDERKL